MPRSPRRPGTAPLEVRRPAVGARKAATEAPPARSTMDYKRPVVRPLKVYSLDPSQGRYLGNLMTVSVGYEDLTRGPVGRKVAVIDYDGTNDTFYDPVDLDHPHVLARGGLDPSESDPHFHQQMVYAVTMATIESFEAALGRRIHWRRGTGEGPDGKPSADDSIQVLKLYPHAMAQANAFYSPQAKGILYGYFKASRTNPGRNLPGQTVFTCLSHDIIVHETTHAIIDGIRAHFTEATNPDVAAFHEAFADVVALFRHFSHKEVLLDSVRRTGGRIFQAVLTSDAAALGPDRENGQPPLIEAQSGRDNPLVQLAKQFGNAISLDSGLRSALGTAPQPRDLADKVEPHDRGSILVAALFDAYFSRYVRRAARFFRIYGLGGGVIWGDIAEALVELLADEACQLAAQFVRWCVRSLDYCPALDITFGDFLRAILTAHRDVDPEDKEGVRDALMEGFRRRGIVADDAEFFSEDSLCWPRLPPGALPDLEGLRFGDPSGLTKAEKDINGRILRRYAADNATALGFVDDPTLRVRIPSFHQMFHVGADGRLQVSMAIEMVQTTRVPFDPKLPELGTFPFRGGATVIVSGPTSRHRPQVRYVISKRLDGEEGEARQRRQRAFYQRSGFLLGKANDDHRFDIDFALIHGRT